MSSKVYKHRGWARRACSKLKWHNIESHSGGWIVRPMTLDEKSRAHRGLIFDKAIKEVFSERIKKEFERASVLYDRLF